MLTYQGVYFLTGDTLIDLARGWRPTGLSYSCGQRLTLETLNDFIGARIEPISNSGRNLAPVQRIQVGAGLLCRSVATQACLLYTSPSPRDS